MSRSYGGAASTPRTLVEPIVNNAIDVQAFDYSCGKGGTGTRRDGQDEGTA
jgi:hypothetical protein